MKGFYTRVSIGIAILEIDILVLALQLEMRPYFLNKVKYLLRRGGVLKDKLRA